MDSVKISPESELMCFAQYETSSGILTQKNKIQQITQKTQTL